MAAARQVCQGELNALVAARNAVLGILEGRREDQGAAEDSDEGSSKDSDEDSAIDTQEISEKSLPMRRLEGEQNSGHVGIKRPRPASSEGIP